MSLDAVKSDRNSSSFSFDLNVFAFWYLGLDGIAEAIPSDTCPFVPVGARPAVILAPESGQRMRGPEGSRAYLLIGFTINNHSGLVVREGALGNPGFSSNTSAVNHSPCHPPELDNQQTEFMIWSKSAASRS
jgi:hypothetical protein